jgi:hypothetical protein
MRTALLIRCARPEADKIRADAIKERRTISNYVISVLLKALETDERVSNGSDRVPGPRTAILVRCDQSEAERVRYEAKRHGVPINVFVLQALRNSWQAPPLRSAANSSA